MVRQAIAILTRRSDDLDILVGVAAVIAVCSLALASANVPAIRPSSYYVNILLYGAGLLLTGGFAVFSRLWKDRPERPLIYLWQWFRAGRRHLVGGLLIMGAAVVFMPTFSAMKSALPLFNEFTWDGTFIAWDRTLHGDDAWKVIHPVLGFPVVSYVLSISYQIWFFLIYIGTGYFAIHVKDRELRRRYLASYFAIWSVVGMLMAVCFASVGPCFAEPILGIEAFKPQMAYLYSANEHYPLFALRVQEFLLDGYRREAFGFARGITAMPSMHVALAFLFFLAMRKVSPLMGWMFGGFFVLILIGSVHLGYHYAVDGYVSIIVTALIWKAAGVWARGHN